MLKIIAIMHLVSTRHARRAIDEVAHGVANEETRQIVKECFLQSRRTFHLAVERYTRRGHAQEAQRLFQFAREEDCLRPEDVGQYRQQLNEVEMASLGT